MPSFFRCNRAYEVKLDAESKTTFLNSLVKIGQGFQEVFGFFGNAIGDALGLTAVKSGDKRSKVGEHFEKIKKGLGDTNNKLKALSGEISNAKNANSSTIESVKSAINSSSDAFDKLIDSLTNLAGVTNDGNPIGDSSAGNAVAADKDSVETVIKEVRNIIGTAEKSGVKIESGDAGGEVAKGAATAPAIINATGAAGQGAGPKLAEEVAKADPWAIINKIKNATINTAQLNGDNNDAGVLATGANVGDANGAKAATNADLAAAVALKAMIKDGKLSANAAANDAEAVKAAAVTAVNKVLGILDLIIRKTVVSNLDKIRETVKGIQYSEITTETTEASTTTQPTAAK
ncbi:variable large family protein [Borrelia puertoricensis]|uniref:variable large family protein n=1 Tax=Borrelia puertoricensis TaxID=2756107 RepID=UPI003D315E4E|nr:variable large family protein [Borrelia puertoricensis]